MSLSERWLPVPGFHNYQISDLGRVRSLRTFRILAQYVNARGYAQLNLWKDSRPTSFLVHRLVAMTFLGGIPWGYQVNHRSGDKLDNRVENLEIVTAQENLDHARANGLLRPRRGEDHPNAKLTEEDVRTIRRLHAAGVSILEISYQYRVGPSTVYSIVMRTSWCHIE